VMIQTLCRVNSPHFNYKTIEYKSKDEENCMLFSSCMQAFDDFSNSHNQIITVHFSKIFTIKCCRIALKICN